MGIDVVKAFLDSVSKALDYIRVFFNKAFVSTVGSIRNISAVSTKRSYYIAFLLLFKERCVVCYASM